MEINYKLESKTEKTSIKTGSIYYVGIFKGEDGVNVEASSFDIKDIKVGDTIKGEIVKNGNFTNFKATKTNIGRSGGNNGAINKAMDKKNESIKGFQENKEISIKLSGAMRDAVLMVTTFYPEASEKSLIDKEVYLQGRIEKWRRYFLDKHGDETDVKA